MPAARALLDVKNIGDKAVQEITELVKNQGLNFGMRFEEQGGVLRIVDQGTPPAALAAADGEES